MFMAENSELMPNPNLPTRVYNAEHRIIYLKVQDKTPSYGCHG